MDAQTVRLASFRAKELENYVRHPKTRPAHLSSRTMEALLIGHPLARMPKEAFRSADEGKSVSETLSLSELGSSLMNLFRRLLVPYILAFITCTFLYRLYLKFSDEDALSMRMRGGPVPKGRKCEKIPPIYPHKIICYGILGFTCLFLTALASSIRKLAVRFTDFIALRTITMATCHIMSRIRHLYGLLQTTDPNSIKNRPKSISYHICYLFESFLRSRLLMLVCNCVPILLCIICVMVDTRMEQLLIRWQLLIAFLHVFLLSCVLSTSLKSVLWFKAFHLMCLAVSLLFINKILNIHDLILTAWQMPIFFFQAIRSVEVFNRTSEDLESVLKKYDSLRESNWFFTNILHVAYILTVSLLLRLVNFQKHLNLLQVLFRYNFLMDPVESILFLVAVCQLPPLTSILILRPQLSKLTESEMQSLLLIGSVQCLLTSARPYHLAHKDFVLGSRIICTLGPLATVCATFVSSIVYPSNSDQKSVLLQHSQAIVTRNQSLSRGLRRLLVNKTRMVCRLLLLLIVSHCILDRCAYYFQVIFSLTLHNSLISLQEAALTIGRMILISTGSYMRSAGNFYESLLTGRLAVDDVLSQELLLHDVYPLLLSSPTSFIQGAKSCNAWWKIKLSLQRMFEFRIAPLLSTKLSHTVFLLLLRVIQNGRQEMLVFVCLLMVNLRRRERLNLLMSLPKLALCHVAVLVLVLVIVNFVTSVEMF